MARHLGIQEPFPSGQPAHTENVTPTAQEEPCLYLDTKDRLRMGKRSSRGELQIRFAAGNVDVEYEGPSDGESLDEASSDGQSLDEEESDWESSDGEFSEENGTDGDVSDLSGSEVWTVVDDDEEWNNLSDDDDDDE
ncbi:hypothetical protein PTI98_009125 [Pleurotus ostreatus]|nr:hypothetical protein PTI98_009060 [Pleurotus ostreatus]KAJ8694198.1 hypothetical protein PTI98_009125 [Pleurotus ostreatus]